MPKYTLMQKKFLYNSFLEIHTDDLVNFCRLHPVLHPDTPGQRGWNNYCYIDLVSYTL